VNLEPWTVNLVAFCFAVLGCCSLPVLVALWLSKSRLHWLIQSLLIVVLAWPLTLVRGYDLLLIVLVTGFSVLIGSWAVQHRRREKLESDTLPSQQAGKDRTRFQFGLSGFGGMFVLLGSFAALLGQANRDQVWTEDLVQDLLVVMRCVLMGVAVAIWGVALPVFRVLKYRFWLPWMAILAVTAVAAGWDLFVAKKIFRIWWLIFADFISFLSMPTATRAQSILGWTVALAVHAVVVALILWFFSDRSSRDRESEYASPSNVRWNWFAIGKKLIGSAFVFLIASSVVFCFARLVKPARYVPKRHVVVGQPNCFPELLEAGITLSELGMGGGMRLFCQVKHWLPNLRRINPRLIKPN